MEATYSHRFNVGDGTVDSICHCCLKTVATATREPDLEIAERRHLCDPQCKSHFEGLAELLEQANPKRLEEAL